MVSSAKGAGLLQRKYIGWLFYDAKELRCTRGIRAYLAELASSKKSTEIAGTNRLASISDGARNLLRLIVRRSHHPKCDPLGRSRAHPRHLSQLRDQIPDCRRIFRSSQSALRFATVNPSPSRLIPTAIASAVEEAAPACAGKIAMEDHLPPRRP